MAKEKQVDALEDAAPGVGVVRDKKLNSLADDFTDKRDEKASLAAEMSAIEAKILDRMDEIGVKVFRYADRIVSIRDGKRHVRIKQVSAADEPEPPDND